MRAIHRLSDRKVRNAMPGMHADGGNLLLQVTIGAAGNINKSWLFRYSRSGHERRMGFGAYPAVTLAEARQRAADARKLLTAGKDPLAEKDAQRSVAVSHVKVMTFDMCRDAYIAAHRAGWSIKHTRMWERSLAMYVTPVFGKMPVSAIDIGLVMQAIESIWTTVPVVAPLVRARIENVLDWAKVRGYRNGENPARWRDIRHLLPAKSKIHTVQHLPSLPYAEVPAFMVRLRASPDIAARALELTILTAARTGEVVGAVWDEIKDDVWTIPAERMKGGKEHRVPLSAPVLRILDHQWRFRENKFVFPGRLRKGMSPATMHALLWRMDCDFTVHGFRSSFRDWAAETTNYPNHVVEMALAHVIGSRVEAAYRRGDLFDKRRRLMDAWCDYLASPAVTGEVVPLRPSASVPNFRNR